MNNDFDEFDGMWKTAGRIMALMTLGILALLGLIGWGVVELVLWVTSK